MKNRRVRKVEIKLKQVSIAPVHVRANIFVNHKLVGAVCLNKEDYEEFKERLEGKKK